jgi:hypothetical protein
MQNEKINLIDEKILELINDKKNYSFSTLKEKVEEILKSVDIFLVESELDSKAADLYLTNVINQRNNIKKQEEKIKVDDSLEIRYLLIEKICKNYEFETKDELIKKIEELEKKTNFELNEINKSN